MALVRIRAGTSLQAMRRPRGPGYAASVFALPLVLVLAGCSSDGGIEDVAPKAPTAINELAPASMSLIRVAFCDLVPAAGIAEAIGEGPQLSRSWNNGDRVPGTDGEAGNEFGCSWSGQASGPTSGQASRKARAWVFARPVTPTFGRALIRTAASERGCTSSRRGFGEPTLTLTCSRGDTRLVRHSGLFGGETWLTCELTEKSLGTGIAARSDRWCTTVAQALNNR